MSKLNPRRKQQKSTPPANASSGTGGKIAIGIGAVVLAVLGGLAKYGDNIGRVFVRHADDVGRGVLRHGDDFVPRVGSHVDDLSHYHPPVQTPPATIPAHGSNPLAIPVPVAEETGAAGKAAVSQSGKQSANGKLVDVGIDVLQQGGQVLLDPRPDDQRSTSKPAFRP